jgi:glutamine synthetase
LASNHIVPTAIEYQTTLLENVKNLKIVFSADEYNSLAEGRLELIREIGGHVSSIKAKVKDMTEARKVANAIDSEKEKAYAYEANVKPYLDDIRYHIDKLELIVDNELWPLPKYRELLFVK